MAISLDSILNSSLIVYIMIIIFIIHAYLKKTNKTFLELCREIREFFRELGEEE